MPKIFITANTKKLAILFLSVDDFPDIQSTGLNLLSINNPILFYNEKERKFQVDKISTQIIILLDELYADTVKKSLKNEIDANKDYLLRHSQPKGLDYSEFNALHIAVGRHDPGKSFKYQPTFEIIFDGEDKKTKRIIELLFGGEEERQAYRKAYKLLTLHYVKSKNSNPNSDMVNSAKAELNNVAKYFDERKEENLAGRIREIVSIKALNDIHAEIEKKLFMQPH